MLNKTRKIAIASLFVFTATLAIVLSANIAYAERIGTIKHLTETANMTYDECLYFSSATVVTEASYSDAVENTPTADVLIDTSGDRIIINAANFCCVGDEVKIKCTIQNDGDQKAKVSLNIEEHSLDCFRVTTSWNGESRIIPSRGSSSDLLVTIKLIKTPTNKHPESFSIALRATEID